jgi:hypothetical protein
VEEEAAEARAELAAQAALVVVEAMDESSVGNGRNATDFCALS